YERKDTDDERTNERAHFELDQKTATGAEAPDGHCPGVVARVHYGNRFPHLGLFLHVFAEGKGNYLSLGQRGERVERQRVSLRRIGEGAHGAEASHVHHDPSRWYRNSF